MERRVFGGKQRTVGRHRWQALGSRKQKEIHTKGMSA